jgi:hypothetical protein
MPGLAKNYNTNTVQLGPGDVWLNVELPATGARPVITAAADGSLTPDATASASAVHLGMTLEGSKFSYTPAIEEYHSDEQAAPIIAAVNAVEATIEGTMIQTLETLILAKLMATGTRTAGSGYEQLTMGDGQALATFTVLLIAPLYADTSKVVGVELYKSFNSAGYSIDVGRKKMAASPFKFTGMSIASRPAVDRVGIWWRTIA